MRISSRHLEVLVVAGTIVVVSFAWQPWTLHGVEVKSAALVTAALLLVLLKVLRLSWGDAHVRREELRSLTPKSSGHLVLVAWLGLGWASLLWSTFPQVTLERQLEVTLLVGWTWLVMASIRKAEDFRLILRTYLVCAVGAAAIGLGGYVLKATGASARLLGASNPLDGLVFTRIAVRPFGNPDFLAGYLIIPVGVAAASALHRGFSAPARVVMGAVLALLLATVVATDSLAGVVASVAVLLLVGVFQLGPERRYRAVELMVGLGVLGAFLGGQVAYRLGAQGLLAFGKGVATRGFFWKWAMVLFVTKPVLGWGAGTTFPTIMPVSNPDRFRHPDLFATTTVHCHNEFLEVAVELGLLGLVLFLSALYLVAKPLGRAYIREERGRLSAGAVGLFAGFFGLNVQACFSVAPRFVEVACFYWLALGLLLAWPRSTGEAPSGDTRPPDAGRTRWKPSARSSVLVLISALACGWVWYLVGWLPLRAAYHFRGGLRAESRRETSVARARYRRAMAGRLPYVDQIRLFGQLGHLEEGAGRHEAALTYYGTAMHMAPGVSPVEGAVRNLLARRERALGHLEPAIDHLEKAVKLDPRKLDYQLRLAECLFQAGRPAEAQELLRKAVELCGDRPAYLQRIRELRDRFAPFGQPGQDATQED